MDLAHFLEILVEVAGHAIASLKGRGNCWRIESGLAGIEDGVLLVFLVCCNLALLQLMDKLFTRHCFGSLVCLLVAPLQFLQLLLRPCLLALGFLPQAPQV